ncbi:hypothetical protein KQI65_00285 [bacterium]|nr:hypothetical protein [bacterium]
MHRRSSNTQVDDALGKLLEYVEAENFEGYDPYDTLKSWLPFQWLGKWGPVLAIQVQKRNPFNIRPLIGVRKGRNPKAIGLFLRAYSQLYAKTGDVRYLELAQEHFQWLKSHPSSSYSSYCWGYDFPWASPMKHMAPYIPSTVVTGFVCKGLYEYFLLLGRSNELEVPKNELMVGDMIGGAVEFILHHIERTVDESGLCFSYTPVMRDACYNASLLGAEVIARHLAISGSDPKLLDLVERSVDFVVNKQLDSGCWNYLIDIDTGQESRQIDFHQGYVIESIEEIMRLSGLRKPAWEQAVQKGLQYYRNQQFTDEGRSWWRLPTEWPVEIHNQSQGIITFNMFDEYRDFAHTIADYTIKNMQDRKGYFYYQKFPLYTNKISYMRWSNAWMTVALSSLV